MIKYNPKIWLSHIFKFYKSDTLKILLPEIFLMGIYTFIICYVEINYANNLSYFKNAISFHTLVGFVLSLLLVFRTNTAYDRWWEGRKLWGQLVNASRNAATKVQTLVPNGPEKTRIKKCLTVFPIILKDHLLKKTSQNYNIGFDDELKEKTHHPSFVVKKIYEDLKNLISENKLSKEEFLAIDKELVQFLEVTGACERIKNTPIPFSYSIFIKKFIFIYCFSLPIGLVPDLYYWAVPFSMFIFYVLVSIEILAEEIEEPFGEDENDLPMTEISKNIKNSVNDIIQ